jgi:hypothetical protein
MPLIPATWKTEASLGKQVVSNAPQTNTNKSFACVGQAAEVLRPWIQSPVLKKKSEKKREKLTHRYFLYVYG